MCDGICVWASGMQRCRVLGSTQKALLVARFGAFDQNIFFRRVGIVFLVQSLEMMKCVEMLRNVARDQDPPAL